MSGPDVSDIDFKNKWLWSELPLNKICLINKINKLKKHLLGIDIYLLVPALPEVLKLLSISI